MAGILEDERDPLDFLADFPTPLTSTQRADLAWHRSKLDSNRSKMKKIVTVFLTRRQQTERFVAEAEAKLDALLNGGAGQSSGTTSAAASVPATAVSCSTTASAATEASPSIAAAAPLGQKRPREEGVEEKEKDGDVRSAAEAEQQKSETVVTPQSQSTHLQAVGVSPKNNQPTPAAVAAPPAAPPRRKFGGAFGGLRSLLVDVKKDNSKDDALRKQREEMARRAEEEKIRGDISIGRGELADIDFRLDTLKAKMDNISLQHSDLGAVLNDMDEQETTYALAFFMNTKGCEAEVGYEISFRPAQTPGAVRDLISRQVEHALDAYLAFRDRTDPFLIEISEHRALRSLKAQEAQHEAEEKAAAAAAKADDSQNVLLSNHQQAGEQQHHQQELVGGTSLGILGSGELTQEHAAAMAPPPPPSDEEDTMRRVMGVGGRGVGLFADELEAIMMLGDGDAEGDGEIYEGGFPLAVQQETEEGDLDRYDY